MSNDKIICRRINGEAVVEGIEPVIVYHSPTGFEWGYPGSGPADLALNILLKVTKDSYQAQRLHQQFKDDFIVPMPEEGGEILIDDVKRWLAKHGVYNTFLVTLKCNTCDEKWNVEAFEDPDTGMTLLVDEKRDWICPECNSGKNTEML